MQELLAADGLQPFVLLIGSHSGETLAALAEIARAVAVVPPGPVPEAASAVAGQIALDGVERATIAAVGGGRVIDAAKALAAAFDLDVAALPTTLSGAEMTAGHRPLVDGRGAGPRRPRLVVNDPALSASQPTPALAASAMNALGHAMEAFYGPGANPVTTLAAARGARLIAGDLEAAAGPTAGEARERLALGALLSGYAFGATGAGLHHVLCQTIVRLSGSAHAQVNAVMLPHTFRFVLATREHALAPFVRALVGHGEGRGADDVITRLAALSGVTALGQLGVADAELPKRGHARERRQPRDHIARVPTLAFADERAHERRQRPSLLGKHETKRVRQHDGVDLGVARACDSHDGLAQDVVQPGAGPPERIAGQ